ncbi:MAG TPA: putative sulfate exporter family transporter [Solirubrobacteraceae bacterium]
MTSADARTSAKVFNAVATLAPGVGAAAAIALAAQPIAALVPHAGAPLIALILGLIVGTSTKPRLSMRGLAFSSRYGLQAAVVVLGLTLNVPHIVAIGARSLPVMLPTIGIALLIALAGGQLLGIEQRLRTLIGVGTGICGASAIAAVSTIIRASEAEIAYALSTIFAFNIVAVIVFPPLGHALGLSSQAYGLWTGTAVNDTSSVAAVGFAYGHATGVYALIVKLSRTTMIMPICLILAIFCRRENETLGALRRTIPWFLVFFLGAAAADSAGIVPSWVVRSAAEVSAGLIATALAAVGMMIRPAALRRTGIKPLLLGAVVWLAVAVSSLALERITHVL